MLVFRLSKKKNIFYLHTVITWCGLTPGSDPSVFGLQTCMWKCHVIWRGIRPTAGAKDWVWKTKTRTNTLFRLGGCKALAPQGSGRSSTCCSIVHSDVQVLNISQAHVTYWESDQLLRVTCLKNIFYLKNFQVCTQYLYINSATIMLLPLVTLQQKSGECWQTNV